MAEDESVIQQDNLSLPVQNDDILYIIRGTADHKIEVGNLRTYNRVEKTIVPAEFLASFTTPIEVIDDPGAGYYISIKSSTLINMADGTTPYDTLNRSSFLSNSDLSNSFGEFAPTCTQSASQFVIDFENFPGEQLQPNQSVVFGTNVNDPINGDHSFKLVVYYSVENF